MRADRPSISASMLPKVLFMVLRSGGVLSERATTLRPRWPHPRAVVHVVRQQVEATLGQRLRVELAFARGSTKAAVGKMA